MWWKRKQQDFNAEIEAHLQLEADQLRSEGTAQLPRSPVTLPADPDGLGSESRTSGDDLPEWRTRGG